MFDKADDQQKHACGEHVVKHKCNGLYLLQDAFGDHDITGIQKAG